MIRLGVQQDETGEAYLSVKSPYHPEFPGRARALGGRWHAAMKEWRFPPEDADRVRAICLLVYGRDDTPPAVVVTVHAMLDSMDAAALAERTLWLVGRKVVTRFLFDKRVILGDRVRVIAGGFPWVGGSGIAPQLAPQPGTILEIRDVPQVLVDAGLPAGVVVAPIMPVLEDLENPAPEPPRRRIRLPDES